MPVTVRPSGRAAEPWDRRDQVGDRFTHATSAERLLRSITTDDGQPGALGERAGGWPGEADCYATSRRAAAAGGGGGGGGGDKLRPGQRVHLPSPSPARSYSRRPLVQSSFADLGRATSTTFATKNGLVHACIEAYNEHHNLVLRPDDVWLAILAQLGAYVNGNADSLRGLLVGHHDHRQRELHIEVDLEGRGPPVVVAGGEGGGGGSAVLDSRDRDGSLASITTSSTSTGPKEPLDHGFMATQMAELLAGSLRDPGLRDWWLPAFSTTGRTDRAVASVLLMGSMQRYFTYSWGTRCGIPSVTLLGDADDWAEIARRCAARLGGGGGRRVVPVAAAATTTTATATDTVDPDATDTTTSSTSTSSTFGPGAERWYRCVLRPVLAGLVETFRDAEGAVARRFWQGIVDKHQPDGSGSVAYSGWITAFCYWDEKGRCLHGDGSDDDMNDDDDSDQGIDGADASLYYSRAGGWGEGGRRWRGWSSEVRLTRGEIPMGFARVPVTLLDSGRRIPTEMLAGSCAIRVLQSGGAEDGGDEAKGQGGPGEGASATAVAVPARGGGGERRRARWAGYDTIQPESGWFMYLV